MLGEVLPEVEPVVAAAELLGIVELVAPAELLGEAELVTAAELLGMAELVVPLLVEAAPLPPVLKITAPRASCTESGGAGTVKVASEVPVALVLVEVPVLVDAPVLADGEALAPAAPLASAEGDALLALVVPLPLPDVLVEVVELPDVPEVLPVAVHEAVPPLVPLVVPELELVDVLVPAPADAEAAGLAWSDGLADVPWAATGIAPAKTSAAAASVGMNAFNLMDSSAVPAQSRRDVALSHGLGLMGRHAKLGPSPDG